ncbi:hypothetical protein GCM10010916_19480 [Paenibacillus abyssi]|uniref:Uncharacterized protein n=1 Tax=Paenibacillus abyssi TaxID=1340531 RepID=A0A917D0V3_9BACL|nr:hypothetical protein GCM10010916_19480 [Paenibacillus abyssi]
MQGHPFKEGCYTEGAKSKTYSVTIKSSEHTDQMAFQESECFKEKAKERYKGIIILLHLHAGLCYGENNGCRCE